MNGFLIVGLYAYIARISRDQLSQREGESGGYGQGIEAVFNSA